MACEFLYYVLKGCKSATRELQKTSIYVKGYHKPVRVYNVKIKQNIKLE